jgi:hypothetical protein
VKVPSKLTKGEKKRKMVGDNIQIDKKPSHLGAVWFKKCNANGNGNGFGSITGGNKFE